MLCIQRICFLCVHMCIWKNAALYGRSSTLTSSPYCFYLRLQPLPACPALPLQAPFPLVLQWYYSVLWIMKKIAYKKKFFFFFLTLRWDFSLICGFNHSCSRCLVYHIFKKNWLNIKLFWFFFFLDIIKKQSCVILLVTPWEESFALYSVVLFIFYLVTAIFVELKWK